MKIPALQFYPADWRKDPGIQSLGYFERGVWFEMLCLMHESTERGVLLLNGIPMPADALANALGLDKQILTTTLTKLTTYGVAKRRDEDGAIYNKRMVEDEKLNKVRREAGKKGGNPALLNQKPTTPVNQKPTPSSSSSSSKPKSKDLERATRLPKNWALPKVYGEWALAEFPNLTAEQIRAEAEIFKDYWVSKGGQKGTSLDWLATWRNWVRRMDKPINGAKPKGAPPWWSSNEAMLAKGEELGLSPRSGEAWSDFKGRIQVKITAGEQHG